MNLNLICSFSDFLDVIDRFDAVTKKRLEFFLYYYKAVTHDL